MRVSPSSPAQLGHVVVGIRHRTSHFGYCAIWGMRPSAIAIPMPEPMSVLPSAAAGIWGHWPYGWSGSALSLALGS